MSDTGEWKLIVILLHNLALRLLAVTSMTLSATGGNWKRGSLTHFERGLLRLFHLALKWNCCTVSVTTVWMLLMFLTCLRYTTQKGEAEEIWIYFFSQILLRLFSKLSVAAFIGMKWKSVTEHYLIVSINGREVKRKIEAPQVNQGRLSFKV